MTRSARSKDWTRARTSSACRLGTTASQTWTASFAFVDIPSCSSSTSRYRTLPRRRSSTWRVRSLANSCSPPTTVASSVQTGNSAEAEMCFYFARLGKNVFVCSVDQKISVYFSVVVGIPGRCCVKAGTKLEHKLVATWSSQPLNPVEHRALAYTLHGACVAFELLRTAVLPADATQQQHTE